MEISSSGSRASIKGFSPLHLSFLLAFLLFKRWSKRSSPIARLFTNMGEGTNIPSSKEAHAVACVPAGFSGNHWGALGVLQVAQDWTIHYSAMSCSKHHWRKKLCSEQLVTKDKYAKEDTGQNIKQLKEAVQY